MTNIVVEFKEASVQIEDRSILRHITASIVRGTVTTIIGPSGSGKTTLLHLINRLIDASSGSILVDGKNVMSWPVQDLRRFAGIVFQIPVMIPGTVLDNLQLPLKIHKRQGKDIKHYLDLVELPHSLLQQKADTLSGGQKQRVALARTLMNDPQILLLDEVTSSLDPSSVQEIERLIVKLVNERHTTILWVTHDLDQAKRLGNDTVFIQQGRIIESGPPEHIFQSPGTPELREFFQCSQMGGNE